MYRHHTTPTGIQWLITIIPGIMTDHIILTEADITTVVLIVETVIIMEIVL